MTAKRKRGKQVAFRMTGEEFEALMKKIEESGMSQQQYLIKCTTEKPIVNTSGIKEITPELKRIGNNLNQIAKSCNQGQKASYGEVQRLGKELNEVWQLLRQLAQGRA